MGYILWKSVWNAEIQKDLDVSCGFYDTMQDIFRGIKWLKLNVHAANFYWELLVFIRIVWNIELQELKYVVTCQSEGSLSWGFDQSCPERYWVGSQIPSWIGGTQMRRPSGICRVSRNVSIRLPNNAVVSQCSIVLVGLVGNHTKRASLVTLKCRWDNRHEPHWLKSRAVFIPWG